MIVHGMISHSSPQRILFIGECFPGPNILHVYVGVLITFSLFYTFFTRINLASVSYGHRYHAIFIQILPSSAQRKQQRSSAGLRLALLSMLDHPPNHPPTQPPTRDSSLETCLHSFLLSYPLILCPVTIWIIIAKLSLEPQSKLGTEVI